MITKVVAASRFAAPLQFLLFALVGCASSGSPTRPVIQEQSTALRAPESLYRTVVPGDTLYSIAWESGQDYRELARWNRILAPYTIKPGQQIRVVPPEAKTGPATVRPVIETRSPAAKEAAVQPGRDQPRTTHKPSTASNVKPAAKNSRAKQTQKPPATKARPVTARVTERSQNRSVATGRWTWPTDGKVVNRYSESDLKGLDITGSRGEPVRAAADGRVVYQGSGLRGYGQLIIIKHNDEFLSAYAHNDRIHVKEGEAVKRGQKIADMGSTGTDRVKLHFEIRRHGAPVDPMKYLPRR